MMRRILSLLLPLSLAPCASVYATVAPHPMPLVMYVGEARVLDESDIKRLAVGDGHVVSTQILGQSQLLVMGETEGQSTIHLWHRDGAEADYSVTVVPANLSRLLSEIQALIGPDPKVSARLVGDKIVLEGHDLGTEQAARLTEVAKRYPQLVNLISHVGMERMVETDVQLMEFNKNKLTQLGIQWQSTGVTGPVFGIAGEHRGPAFTPPPQGTGTATVPQIPVAPRVIPFSTFLGLSTALTSMINAAVTDGQATFLSEPRLVCMSGGSAKFLAGGEVPIPMSGVLGEISVEFKPYGVKLEVDPVVADSGLIRLKVFTELSAVDPTVSVNGIPGFLTRRTETEVDLHTDETLVISGMFDGSTNKTLNKIPGVGDIPVLGELFKSRDFQRNRTDLVMFLTPHIIGADSQRNREAIQAGEAQRQEIMKDDKLLAH
jgi:pilus assembly protein CpaC